ncbi:MAG: efflux RND transporter periplasmic adaptor subunit [Longimicrobiales bacterium]|nr:efflux RND transporter periplasmic adaptor subunit [Longimicrobiales bacterium]
MLPTHTVPDDPSPIRTAPDARSPSSRLSGARAQRPFLALGGLTLLLAGCSGGGDGGDPGGGPPPAPVEVAVARTDTVLREIRAVGSLEAEARVTVKAESTGRVVAITVREGAPVAAGGVLLRLEAAKLEAEAAVAEAAAVRAVTEEENLARQVERNRSLLSQGAISPQAFDDLQAAHRSAQARVQEAEAALRLTRERLADATVRAPFGGEVGMRMVDLGDYVAPGDDLFQLVDNDPMEVRFAVPERYLGAVAPGARVEVRVRNLPEGVFAGEVVFLSPAVDPASRTVVVKARVSNPDGRLRAGQFADVRMELERRTDAVVVPESAVVTGRADDAVFVVRGGSVVRRPVTLGTRMGADVEILEGLAAGDTVVVAGQQRLSDGAPVAVQTGG